MHSGLVRGRLKAFRGPDAQERAARVGMWAKAVIFDDANAARRCRDHGVAIQKDTGEGINSAGGVLVPDDMMAGIIAVRELAGTFRKNANVIPMHRDTLDAPRRTSGLTTYFVGEGVAPTTSQVGFDNVRLTAKKIAALTKLSTEIAEDSDADVGEFISAELGYAMALQEDSCGWVGDGTSTYGGMRGITTLIIDGLHSKANIPAASTHSTLASITTVDLGNLVAGVMAAALPGAKWYCSQIAFAQVFCRLSTAIVGRMTIGGEQNRPVFWGFEIEPIPTLPQVTTSLAGSVMLCFGDLAMGAMLGDRRGSDVRILRERYADADQIGIMGTERFDINIHDAGTNSAVGPIAGLVGTS